MNGVAITQNDSREANETPGSIGPDLVPVGDTPARVLELQPPREIVELTEKMNESIAAHPDWIETYVANHDNLPAGTSLPYHENFGITPEQYQLFGDTLANLPLTPSSDCILRVTKAENGKLLISGSGAAERLTGLIIDTELMSVSFGGIECTSWRKTESPTGAIFPVNGITWKKELPNSSFDNIETLFVKIGTHTKTGNGILMFRVFNVKDREILDQEELNLEWDR